MVRLPFRPCPYAAILLALLLVPMGRSSAQSVKLSPPLGTDGNVVSFALGRAGGLERAVFRADQDRDGSFKLFTVPLDGSAAPLLLSPPPSSIGFSMGVDQFWISPDGTRVLFANFEPSESLERLLRVPIDGSTAAVPIADSGPGGIFSSSAFVELAFTADGSRALFRSQLFDDKFDEASLFQVPVNGSQAQLELGTGRDSPQTFVVSQDGSRVAFVEGITSSAKLFACAIDGTQRVQLNTPGRPVDKLHITGDGGRVLFLEGGSPNLRLFSIASDGSRRKELNGALAPGGGVTDYLVAPDERTVVYRADQSVDGRFELFRVPIDGRRPPRRALDGSMSTDVVLLTPLSLGQAVQPDFAFSVHDEQVLFRADARTPGVGPRRPFELFRVALDGNTDPVLLSAPLVAGGDVTSFAVAPDGQRVVYRADQRRNDVFELFVASLAGGPVVALDTMPALGDVFEYRVAPDFRFVAYRADRDANDVFELFGAPLDGSAPARKLNGPLVTGGDVQGDFVPVRGGRALYRADQEADGVLELFEGFLDHGRPAPRVR